MNDLSESVIKLADLANDPRWQLAQRVVAGHPFQRSPRLREFLLFIVQQTLAGHAADISEYEIGYRVFKRSAKFNSAEDSIVRSSAHQLRTKLQDYFEAEGRSEPMVIVVHRGGYVPDFVPRATAETPRIRPAGVFLSWKSLGIGGAILFGLLILGLALALQRSSLSSPEAASIPAPVVMVDWVFGPSAKEFTVVMEDNALVIVNSFRPKILTLDEYIGFKEQDPLPWSPARPVGTVNEFPGKRLITSFRQAALIEQLGEMSSKKSWKVNIRHSRLMQVRDFQKGSFLLLGNAWSDPWVSLFEDRLNFRFIEDAGGHWVLKNMEPQPGESPAYSSPPAMSRNGISYGRLAVLTNLTNTGIVLIASGLHGEAAEGSAQAIVSPEFFHQVEKITGGTGISGIASLELLLEVNAVDSAVESTRVLASRIRSR